MKCTDAERVPVHFIITGAGSGIGLATARLLASRGHDLALFDQDLEALKSIATTLVDRERVLCIGGDLSSEADMGRAAEDIATRFGRLDAVVANAGIKGVWAPVDDLTPDEWDTTIRVNLRGTYLALNKTVPLLKANGGGAIVVVSSINGVRTFTDPGATAYSATKAAQVAMTEQLALELGRHRGYRTLHGLPGEDDLHAVHARRRTGRRHAERGGPTMRSGG